MKLWNVSIEYEIIVVAEDSDEAEEIAERVARKMDDEPFVHASSMSYYPAGDTDKCIPYGEDDTPSLTIGEWKKRIATEKEAVAVETSLKESTVDLFQAEK